MGAPLKYVAVNDGDTATAAIENVRRWAVAASRWTLSCTDAAARAGSPATHLITPELIAKIATRALWKTNLAAAGA